MMDRYCDVIVEIAKEQVARLFTYRIPEGMVLQVGMRVLVPFGPRSVEGYVLQCKDTAELEDARIRNVSRTLEDYPVLLPWLIDLAQWMTKQYHCLLVEALRLMMPAQMRGERVRAKTRQQVRLAIEPAQLAQAIAAQSRAPRRAQTLECLAQGPRLLSDLSREAVKALVEQGLVEIRLETQRRRPQDGMQDVEIALDPPLMPSQKEVLASLLPALEEGKGRFLLHGVTGSGKTEVYIRLIRQALRMGCGAIVLVPEIALTPQMVGWFRKRFGEVAAVLHSGLSIGERYDEWRRIRTGEARVVIGARSAVFAPV
ncbi:MAG: DEAD/DEAH box helicase family protein, partial [Clostridia bacterium]